MLNSIPIWYIQESQGLHVLINLQGWDWECVSSRLWDKDVGRGFCAIHQGHCDWCLWETFPLLQACNATNESVGKKIREAFSFLQNSTRSLNQLTIFVGGSLDMLDEGFVGDFLDFSPAG